MYSNRWWESYLVRYFMPSIAGIAIVAWLVSVGGDDFRKILFFGHVGEELTTPVVILLVLYGNLFCYIASYPILGFHATRVIDYSDVGWKPTKFDGNIVTFSVGVLTLLVIIVVPNMYWQIFSFAIVIIFSAIQLCRVKISINKGEFKGLKGQTPKVYAYVHALAKRRGNLEITNISALADTDRNFVRSNTSNNNDSKTIKKTTNWHKEVIESYRHMREHGNSAFIFFLEIILSALCFMLLSVNTNANVKLSMVAILFSIWALPAISVHMLGQSIERRFSHFDRRVQENPISQSINEINKGSGSH